MAVEDELYKNTYTNESSNDPTAVAETKSIPPEVEQQRWEFAARQQQAANDCEEKIMSLPYPDDGQLYCNRTFDNWGCWNDTLAGTRAYIPCPAWAHDGFDPRLFAFKDCNDNGTWWTHPLSGKPWSNYTSCVDYDELARQQTINLIYVIGYSVSLVFLLASLFIFFYFRQLSCTRITIHKHLFVSFIIHNIVWIIHDNIIPSFPERLKENGWACRLFHTFIRYILVCNYFWMFCEGFYLHTVLVVAFAKTEILMKAFYAIGWGLPVIPAFIYAVVRVLDPLEDKNCWISAGKYLYILAVPVIISLVANLIFLCNIVRVLITKMRATNSREDHHTRKAVRATLILVPLLGLQYILFPFRPDESVRHFIFAYDIASAVCTSLQGLFVAVIFCFCNGEVMDLSKRQIRTRRESYVLNRHRSSLATSSLKLNAAQSKHMRLKMKYTNSSSSPSAIRRGSHFQESIKFRNENNHKEF